MKRILIITAALAVMLSLCGCYDLSEPNDLVYVTAVGIDEGSSMDNYSFTLQYAKVIEINSGAESGESGTNNMETVTVDAPGIYSAVSLAGNVVSKQFALSHIKLIVFSEAVAGQGIKRFGDLLLRGSDFRPHVFTAVSAGSAKEYLDAVRPVIEVNPVKYYELIYDGKYSSYLPYFDTHRFCLLINSDEGDMVMPYAARIGKGGAAYETETEGMESGFEYGLKNYMAGGIKRGGENPVEALGMAVFDGDRLKGTLGVIDTEVYNMLTGQFNMDYITFYNSASDSGITVLIEQAKKPVLKTNITDGVPSVEVRLYYESELSSIPEGDAHEENLPELEREISVSIQRAAERLLERSKTEYNCDILGIGGRLKSKFMTYDDYINYNFKDKYRDTKFSVKVNYKIRRTGILNRSSGDGRPS